MPENAPRGERRVEGSWALVTGSTSGIGRETALRLAADGYSIVVCGRSADRAAETRHAIEESGARAVALLADLTDSAAVRRLITEAKEATEGGAVEVLVNNAGGGGFAATEDTTEEMFDAAFALNVKAPYLLTGAFAPAMAERGHGAIVNVGSLSTSMAASGTSAFQAAKAALSMLTKSWTAEYGPRGVRINSVDPGYVLTRVNEHIRDMFGGYLAGLPAGRGAEPGEVAEAIRFLVSPKASYIHGAVLAVDGGRTPSWPCDSRPRGELDALNVGQRPGHGGRTADRAPPDWRTHGHPNIGFLLTHDRTCQER